MTILKKSLK